MQDWLRRAGAALDDDRGATAIEYALLAALIAGAIVTIALTLGETVAGAYDTVNDALEAEL